jgi:RNA polymerase sigma factor (sigma-70 family)
MDDDPKTLDASMKRTFFDYALKFRGEGSSISYFKRVLPHNDEFKKASVQTTTMGKNGTQKTRKLKSKHERSGGSINDLDKNKFTTTDHQYSNTEGVEWMITLTQIMELLDDPKEKQALNLLHEGFTQKKIAEMLNIHQSTVSRLPQKIKKIIK